MIKYILLAFLVSFSYSQQADRERPDSTDLLEINPLSGLHYIELTIEKDVFIQKQITDKSPSDNFYFRVEGDDDYAKVSYFGNNLSDYVTNIEPAYNIMKSYRNLKITENSLFWGGLLMVTAGAAMYLSSKEVSPIIFIGIGSSSISWIPNYFSNDKIPQAIDVYNKSITKYQALNNGVSLKP